MPSWGLNAALQGSVNFKKIKDLLRDTEARILVGMLAGGKMDITRLYGDAACTRFCSGKNVHQNFRAE